MNYTHQMRKGKIIKKVHEDRIPVSVELEHQRIHFTQEEIARYEAAPKDNFGHALGADGKTDTNLMYKQVAMVVYTHILEIDRGYMEERYPLKQMLTILQKLSGVYRGANAKALHLYYQKMAFPRINRDVEKLYSKKEGSFPHSVEWTSYDIHCNNKSIGHSQDVVIKHVNRCIAILIEKGYIEVKKTTSTRSFRRSRSSYTYHNSWYQLTDKAVALIGQKVSQ